MREGRRSTTFMQSIAGTRRGRARLRASTWARRGRRGGRHLPCTREEAVGCSPHKNVFVKLFSIVIPCFPAAPDPPRGAIANRAQTRVGRPHSRTWAGSRSSWPASTLVSKVGPRTVFRSARQGAATRRGSSATAAPLVGRARAPPARARNQVLGSPEARERRRIVRTSLSRACPRHDFPGRR